MSSKRGRPGRLLVLLIACLAMVAAPRAMAAPGGTGDVPDIQWPPEGVQRPHYSADHLMKRSSVIRERMIDRFGGVVPGAKKINVKSPSGDTGQITDGMGFLSHFVFFTDEVGTTGVSLQYNEPAFFPDAPAKLCTDVSPEYKVIYCDGEKRPDGSVLVGQLVESKQGNEWKPKLLSVHHFRPDGTVVWATGYNYDPLEDGDVGPNRENPSVTRDQLAALVTDPEVGL